MASALFIAMSAVSCDKGGDDNTDGPGGNEPGGSAILLVAQNTVNFIWNNPPEQSIRVTTDAEGGWSVSQPEKWYTAVKEGNNLVIKATTNDTGAKRSHVLTVSAAGAESKTVTVNQSAEGELAASLTGSAYYVWAIDAISLEAIKDKILFDMGPDGGKKGVDIWETGNTLVGVETTGPNFYGTTVGGWMAFEVAAGVGWSGGAYTWQLDEDIDWSPIIEDGGDGWYLHAAIKGSKGFGHRLRLLAANEPSGVETTSYSIQFDNYPTLSETEWTEVEVPMKSIVENGWEGCTRNYTMSFHGSGSAGKKLEWDALFIYKK